MAENNSTILSTVYLNGSNDYQQRIPDPTQSTIAQQMEALFDPMNGRLYNEFVDVLINRIGTTYVHQQLWNNPLAQFKKGKLPFGATVQEMAVKWVRAHSYDDADETLLKLNRPEAAQWFHTMNRQNRYDISIVRDELGMAFTSENTGLNDFLSAVTSAPRNSDEYDEYRCMLQLIAEYEDKWGFFKYHLNTAPSDETSGKAFLKAVRSFAGKLQFPTSLYNAKVIDDIPVFAKPSELVLFMTPETSASIDVDTLAGVFQLDKADLKYRTILVDEFPIPNAVALLTTEDFYQCWDTVYENQSFWDPKKLATQYFLHHWSILSVSPFVPAILFTTDAATDVKVLKQEVSGFSLSAAKNSIKAGETVQLTGSLTGTITENNAGITVAPDSFTWSISTSSAPLNSRTYVDRLGVLHTQKTFETGEVITVTAVATYINPSGETGVYTDSVNITIANDPTVAITAYSLAGVAGTITDGAIAVTVPSGTAVTSLAATFTATTGATVKVGSTTQVSGTTTNNFTNPVTYKVIKGEVSNEYVVTVTVAE